MDIILSIAIIFFVCMPYVVKGEKDPTIILSEVGVFGVFLPNPLCPSSNPNCARSDVQGLLESIVNWLIEIGAIVVVGMVIWGAFQMMFAGGDPEKFKTGRNTIFYAVIGYAILLIGWGITAIIEQILTT